MSDRECMLDDEWLSRLRQKARVKLPEEELDSLVIYTFVDPTGGSETGSSECGIVSIVRTLSGEVILIGATSVNTQTEPELNDLFQAYFTSFAVHEVLKDLPHFLFIEKNQGGAFIADLMVRRAKWSLPTIQEVRKNAQNSTASRRAYVSSIASAKKPRVSAPTATTSCRGPTAWCGTCTRIAFPLLTTVCSARATLPRTRP